MKKAAWTAPVVPAALLAALLSGCPVSYEPGQLGASDDSGGAEQREELFVQQPDQSWLFSTNDPAFWGPSGYTLWALPLAGQGTFVLRDVDLVKTSGNAWAGYGIVFCQEAAGSAGADTMLLVMINTQQQYSLGEANGSQYTPYTSPAWATHAGLARGYGTANRVTVTRDADGLFTLYLNQVQVTTFHDGRTPARSGGGDGYLAVISPQDRFPASPVSVSYTER